MSPLSLRTRQRKFIGHAINRNVPPLPLHTHTYVVHRSVKPQASRCQATEPLPSHLLGSGLPYGLLLTKSCHGEKKALSRRCMDQPPGKDSRGRKGEKQLQRVDGLFLTLAHLFPFKIFISLLIFMCVGVSPVFVCGPHMCST